MKEETVWLGIKATLAILLIGFVLGFVFEWIIFVIFLFLAILSNFITSIMAYYLLAQDKIDKDDDLTYGIVVYILGIVGVWLYLKKRKELLENKETKKEIK